MNPALAPRVVFALLALVLALAKPSARAAQISYEGFDYPADTTVSGRNGGSGWQGGWSGVSGVTTKIPGLQFPGLAIAAGRAQAGGNNAAVARPITSAGFAALRSNGRFGIDGTEVWLSFLARREAEFLSTDYAGLTLLDGGAQELFVGRPSRMANWSFQLFDLGAQPGNITSAAQAPIATGETTLLVLRLQFGVNGIQDRVELFVDPPPGATPTNPDAARTGADIHFNSVRAQSGPGLAVPMSFDEIRLGETFADVVPATAGPAIAWLRAGSQRITAGAELTVPLHYNWSDGDASSLALTVTASDGALLPADRIVVSGSGANRLVTFRPPPGAGGTTAIQATVTPPGAPAVSASFDLVIEATPADELLAYDGFDYTPVGSVLSGKNGGQGFAGAWAPGVDQGIPGSRALLGPGSLEYPGLAVTGARTVVASGTAQATRRPLARLFGEDGTVRYVSLLVRPDALPSATAYFGLQWIGSAGRDLFVGKPGGGNTLRYVLEDAGGAGQFASSTPVTLNAVALLVVRLEFRPGRDRIALFVNPVPGSPEPAVPDAIKNDLDLGTVVVPALNGLAAWSGDELRIGTSFASVTPVASDFRLRPIPPSNTSEGTLFTRQIETLEPLPPGRTLTFEFVGDHFAATLDPATGAFAWIPGELDGGATRSFTVRVTSNAAPPATRDLTFLVSVEESNQAPQLNPVDNPTVWEGSELSVQLVASDADIPAQPIRYALVTAPPGMSVSDSGLLRWKPTPEQAGRSFPVTVVAHDTSAGRAERSFNVLVVTRTTTFARWIGTTAGDWNNPNNWDIGRVPNDTDTEVFDVVWEEHLGPVRIDGNITVRRFDWRSRGTLWLPEAGGLTVRDQFSWAGGELTGRGRLTAKRRSDLQHLGATKLSDRVQLNLEGICELTTTLYCEGDVKVTVGPAATLNMARDSGLHRVSGQPELRNEGRIAIHSPPNPVRFIFLRNFGRVDAYVSSLEFQTGMDTYDLIQEPSGRLVLGAGRDQRATLDGKVLLLQGSSVLGQGHIRDASIGGTLSGSFSFDRLALDSTATTEFELRAPRDQVTSFQPLTLAGRLALKPLPTPRPGPNDEFLIMLAEGEIIGEFANSPFGQRVQTSDGGSFLFTRTADSRGAKLGRYLPRPVHLEGVALDYQLPEPANPSGGCFIAPHPAVFVSEADVAGASLWVEFTKGYESGKDSLSFRSNPAFPEVDVLTFEGPADGEQTVRFNGKAFATVRLTPDRLTGALNDQASTEAVVALLGRLHYGNNELTADWFTTAAARYPERIITVRLTDVLGAEHEVLRSVDFPFLWGLQIDDSPAGDGTLLLEPRASKELQLLGRFSNGQTLPVPLLNTTWTTSCTADRLAAVAGSPGKQSFTAPESAYCCTVYAVAEPLSGQIYIYKGEYVKAEVSGFVGLAIFFCPALEQYTWRYSIPDCPYVPPPGRAVRHGPSDPLVPPQSPIPLYTLESLMRQTAAGQRLVNLYREHGPEVARLFLTQPTLLLQSQQLIAAFQPGVSALLAGKGDTLTLTPAIASQVNDFWNALARHASPALQAVLAEEQARFGNFRVFEGRSFADWAAVLQLPVPTRPVLHISLAATVAGRFRLAANDIAGASFTLWRSTDLADWEMAPNTEIERDGLALFLTDPAPPAGGAYYQIRY